MTLEEMLRKRAELVTAKEAKEQEVSEIQAELGAIDQAVLAKFDAEGMSSVKVPGLGSFISQERIFASIGEAFKDGEGIRRIKAHYPELVIETVNGQTLSAFWREARKTGQELPAEIRECVKESVTRYIQWRR